VVVRLSDTRKGDMSFTEVEGDLFTLGLPAIAHGCNCRGSMGAGIARQFRSRFPEMYAQYADRCRAGRFAPGDVFVWDAGEVVVYNLATQLKPGADARLDAISVSVRAALADAAERRIRRLGVPRLGAGIGGLDWNDVADVLHAAAATSTVELVVVTWRPGGETVPALSPRRPRPAAGESQ
jgi:O-acetyl-ADP-ribose deacetylase (regulator of RNase III)